jgi:hypothetical protein
VEKIADYAEVIPDWSMSLVDLYRRNPMLVYMPAVKGRPEMASGRPDDGNDPERRLPVLY